MISNHFNGHPQYSTEIPCRTLLLEKGLLVKINDDVVNETNKCNNSENKCRRPRAGSATRYITGYR